MRLVLVIIVLFFMFGCASHSITTLGSERHVLIPSKQDFLIKIGGRTQVGVKEYLIIGQMEYENKNYFVIQFPHDVDGMIFYGLVCDEGKLFSKMIVPISQEKGLQNTKYVIVPAHEAKAIPDDVRFF